MKRMILGLLVLALMVITGRCGEVMNPAPLSIPQVIESLKLQPMSDVACKGYYLSTYESKTLAAVDKNRAAASLIYYLMTPEIPVDPWHVITSDEVMLYHAGAPMAQLLLHQDGRWEEIVLGPEFDKGQVAQTLIPAGTWMGFAKLPDPRYNWGLYGVMVIPGWHQDDIHAASNEEVMQLMSK
ncbi:MAG: cupin domain-containing protein, partial [Lentisphaerota bacterium]